MTERRIGEIVDQLGIICDLDEQDHVIDAVVLMRVANTDDGGTRFGMANSPHTDFIVRRGLVKCASEYEAMEPVIFDDEEGFD